MKSLVFVRHGKSSWEFDVIDRNRPLKKRGINDADLVSKEFKTKGFRPDYVYSSPANRAHSTCKIFVKNLKIEANKTAIIEDLYDFGGSNVLNFVRNLNNSYSKVMIFGHNHAFTSLINRLGDTYIDNLPTSGLVKIDFDISRWNEINLGITDIIIFPRHLKD